MEFIYLIVKRWYQNPRKNGPLHHLEIDDKYIPLRRITIMEMFQCNIVNIVNIDVRDIKYLGLKKHYQLISTLNIATNSIFKCLLLSSIIVVPIEICSLCKTACFGNVLPSGLI